MAKDPSSGKDVARPNPESAWIWSEVSDLRIVSDALWEAAVAAYAAHINCENREQRIQADADARALARIERAVADLMAPIKDGLYQPAMKARMAELEREREEITARLVEAPPAIPDVHPGIAEISTRKVARFTATLSDPDTRLDASSGIRSLVGILDFVNDNPPRGQPSYDNVASGFAGATVKLRATLPADSAH